MDFDLICEITFYSIVKLLIEPIRRTTLIGLLHSLQ